MTTTYGNMLWAIVRLASNTIETNEVTHETCIQIAFDLVMCFEFGFLWQNVLQHAYTLKEIFYITILFAVTILIVPHDNQSITTGYSCKFNYIKITIIVVWLHLFKINFNPNFDIVNCNWRFCQCSLNLVFSISKFFGFNLRVLFKFQNLQAYSKIGAIPCTHYTPKCYRS